MNKMIDANKVIAGISLVPESAPFNAQQRAWLNGFFAGMTGIQEMLAQGDPTTTTDTAELAASDQEEEDFPWHDDTLGIQQRLELAADRPYDRQLMAAMAQLDCGSCGYICQTYSEAIASGAETSLNLCTPGGKETFKTIKKLVKLEGDSGGSTAPAAATTPDQASGYSRQNPFPAKLIKSEKLTGEGSAKDVRHVEIDLSGSDIQYDVGDALGLFPTNCPDLVGEVVALCECVNDAGCFSETLLTRDLSAVPEEICELYAAGTSDADQRNQINTLIADDDQLDEMDLLDFMTVFAAFRPSADQLLEHLPALNPRLYSIASSPKAHDDQVHLTVGKVTWQQNQRTRRGVASTLLAERCQPGDSLSVFIQKSHGFTVPAKESTPMIMVGPGTGIAPFIGFLQERDARRSSGKHWLFFGDQKSSTDFLYSDQLNDYVDRGVLTRLDTAFSRDQAQKVYVQDRMKENAAELYCWLQEGAAFYVCGDASRMAKDVDRTLHEIIAEQGNVSADQAKAYVKKLKDENRYCRDVY